MLETGMLILGLVLAVYGAIKLVDGGTTFARRFNISEVVIGAIVVGFGTSMPEFTVNIVSSIHHEPGLAITNILGSNIFNIFLILGVAALIHPLSIADELRKKEIPYNLIAAVLVGVCGNEMLIDGLHFSTLIPSDGIVFLFFFAIFLYFTMAAAHDDAPVVIEKSEKDDGVIFKSIFFMIFGLVLLVGGGELIVQGATGMAKKFGLSDHFIGLLIVGPGTSFPELIATVVAVIKKRPGMAVGNIVGSNIFNIFCILGLSSIICPLPLQFSLNMSVLVCIGASLLLYIFAYTGKERKIGKIKGILFLLLYAIYVTYLIKSG